MEKNILFPIDFSDRAASALSEAIPIAKSLHAKLVVYHVYHRPAPDHEQYDLTQVLSTEAKHIDEEFQNLYDSHPDLKEIKHEFVKEVGVSVHEIPAYTDKYSFDLIVMATKGA